MDPKVRAAFDEMRDAHRLAIVRTARHDRKMQALDAAWRARMDRADQRMEKFDQQLQAMRKLVEAGMKIVSHLAADTRELKRSQKAFLDSLRNSGNGRRHA